jgi:hypothetical protein
MNARQKRFCINAGFAFFTALAIEVGMASETGKFSFGGVLVEMVIAIVGGFLFGLLRYFIG